MLSILDGMSGNGPIESHHDICVHIVRNGSRLELITYNPLGPLNYAAVVAQGTMKSFYSKRFLHWRLSGKRSESYRDQLGVNSGVNTRGIPSK